MGPWARSLIAAAAGNAERPELEVEDLRIEPGVISARVDGCEVTLTAAPIPQRIWTALTRYAKGMGQLEDAVEGRVQSVHLEHLLQEDWGEQLIPRPRAIAQLCSCDADSGCDHCPAVAYAFIDGIELSPRVLLRWRGVSGLADAELDAPGDPWRGRDLGSHSGVRPMARYAVLRRLGSAGLPSGGVADLTEALRVAYEALAETKRVGAP